jgi:tRNA(Ile)-lysidine synthase
VGARRIVTAHHAADQAETVLLALFRGAGPDGLAGMAPRRPLDGDLTLERPLLRTAPDELVAYCRRERLPYARDATNADTERRRNAVRAALATLRASFPHLDEAVARCAEIARDERAANRRASLRAALRDALAERVGLRDVPLERVDAAVRLLERGARGRVFLRKGLEAEIGG